MIVNFDHMITWDHVIRYTGGGRVSGHLILTLTCTEMCREET